MALAIETEQPIPFARTVITARARQAASRVMASGWVTTGPEVVAFEKDFAQWVGAQHAVGVASCTAAIEISLRALELAPGSRVLTSTITFCGAIHAIIHAGHIPVLADVDPVTLMPSADTIAAALGQGVEAMVVTHYGGHGAPVMELAAAARLPLSRVVEDAAHALGTTIGARRVGSISGATCFSFYATKNLPIGEGGMITTDDARIASLSRTLRIHGMSGDAWKRYMPGASWRYDVTEDGIKANMTDVQAAIGRVHLTSLASWQRRREELAAHYDAGLSFVRGIVPPPHPADGRHAWHLYVIKVKPEFGVTRDELISALTAQGIHCSVHFIPNHLQPYFRRFVARGSDFSAADAAFREIVSLPFYHSLTTREIDRVCAAIAEIGASSRVTTTTPTPAFRW